MSLSKVPVWRGAKGLTETEDSPEIVSDLNGTRVTQSYMGTYETALSKRPAVGATVTGFGAGVTVRTSTVKKAGGGRAVLTVVSQADITDAPTSTPLAQPEYEIDWVRYDLPLATHNIFKNAISAARLRIIEKGISDGEEVPLAGEVEVKYYEKRIRGADSYMLFCPVIRRMTPHATRPTTTTAGKISTPPISISPFTYVKTADGARKQGGRWVRNEEWTGSYAWDTDLYAP